MNLTACSPMGLLLPVIIILSVCTLIQSWRLDCTKFVFAPRCRGVAAKRSSRLDYNTAQYIPQKYSWNTADSRPYKYSFPETEVSRNSEADSPLDTLYNQPHDSASSIINAWKTLDRKYPENFRERQQAQARIKAYLEAIWQSMDTENNASSER